ncbi:NAD-dependent epimerase/dehydratase family protein [Massilioclostridium coli]|uniref:NAD-dependent epimerase/dehydratase family protein n=1 Tax=Massilioclostridium coli TaxID=1870991 RepID=UPI00085CDEE5|nr:NAD-dependent epimerase/dehydratase family protein [Massilioclostridium coli]
MANFLVTGAAGFIGSHLAKKLVIDGHQVTTIDNLSTGFIENIPSGVKFIEGNDYDPDIIAKLGEQKFDAIFHIAGQSGGMTSFDDPIYDMNSNIASTLILLDYAKRTGCNRFIYASSMSVYGDENPCPVTEESEIKPKTFYAVGKLASEHYMRIYSTFGIRCTSLRFNNTYGIGQNMQNLRQGMVSIFLAQAVNTKRIHVMGDKERFRDFTHVSDNVKACLLAAQGQEESFYNVYNVCTNRKTTCEELISEICKHLPYSVEIEYSGSTPGDQFGIYCDYTKIQEKLGWEPTVQLESGIKEMVEWALDNKTNNT